MQQLKYFFLCTVPLFLFLQTKCQTKMNYEGAWEKADQLNDKGLPKSAAQEVQKIYEQAKKDRNNGQLIKAVIFQINLEIPTSENGEEAAIRKIETEIKTASSPVKQILQSVAAKMYWNYFQNNRWKFYNRTPTTETNKDDIATWTLADLHQKTGELFLASLQDTKRLQQISLSDYEPALIRGNTRNLRPTLYDLLANRALDYFENDEKDITRPAYAFTIAENAAFDPAADFVHHRFETADTASLHYRALLIYQQLLAFHREDSQPGALMDADLRRLQFVYRYATMPEKDDAYRLALTHLISQYENLPVSAQPSMLLAGYYHQQGSRYDKAKGNEEWKDAYVKAKDICEKTITRFPGTEGAIYCNNLLNTLLRKSLRLTTEKVNIPGEAFRTLVKYTNLSTAYFRIIPVNKTLKDQWENNYEKAYWNKLSAQTPLRSWKQDLPATNDYRQHAVEIKIDPLPEGTYILLGSVNNSFSTGSNLMAAQLFFVSNISYVNSNDAYFVLHRNTGKPLAGATIQVWTSRYDYTDRKNKLHKAELLTADPNGYFSLKTNDKTNRNVRLEINWQKDHLFPDDYEYQYTRFDPDNAISGDEEYEEKNAQIFFFTDRSIYRPGQTVYFKGIAITRDPAGRKAKLITGKSVKLFLKDVNNQVVDSLLLTLNDYGSVHGQFRLPQQQTLTGNFNISTEDYNQSNIRFSVEEYKRPTFQVTIHKPGNSYRLNDTVSITGSAKAYAGNNIDGAQVKYRVSRQARFLYPWLYYRWGLPRTTTMEITNGVTTTDNNGNFQVTFAAIPDLSISQSLQPVFDYSIEAEVTDINGETRSSREAVQVGYTALELDIALPAEGPIATDQFKSIAVSSKNLNGEFEPVHTQLAIYPLKDPGRLIRSRFWERPDQFLYSEKEFISLFPNDEYKDEGDYQNREKETVIYSDTLTTAPHVKFQISNLKFHPGWYSIEVTAKDRFGAEVKNIRYVQLYSRQSSNPPATTYFWTTGTPKAIEPGGSASILSGSSARDVFLIQQTDKNINDYHTLRKTASDDRSKRYFQYYHLNNENKDFRFGATEEDRGGYGVAQFFVKHNRFYSNSAAIAVPWTNKELEINFTTFRNKMEPGSREKWEMKISGAKGEKIAAEILASMYDASLDQFRAHNWHTPAIWPVYYNWNNLWNGRQNFLSVQSSEKDEQENATGKPNETFTKTYDQLIDANFSRFDEVIVTGYGIQKRTGRRDAVMSMQKVAMPAPPPAEMAANEEQAIVKESEMEEVSAPFNEINPPVRKNFNETAFFFPDLKTDKDGNVSFSFTIPEALTQWKLMTFAHTPDLAMGYAQQMAVTQKELMVQPNAPRFVREKDSLFLSAKIVNLSDSLINGFVKLELVNAVTGEVVDHLFQNAVPVKDFSVSPAQSTAVAFGINVPDHFNTPVLYRVIATSLPRINGSTLSDGEENVLPVLSNRMLVTDALPLNMRGSGTRQFKFESLLKSGNRDTVSANNYALTVEYAANPLWYVIQSLPYLTEYPYECSEQTFNRYYANLVASHIANSAPRIKAVYDQWRKDTAGSKTLVSALEKNQELKNILLEETPWVMQAKNESEQKQNIALLFDLMRMKNEAASNFNKLKEMQSSNGGFVWFKGGRDDRYITQYILSGIGHLQKLDMLSDKEISGWKNIVNRALQYADARIQEDYDELVKRKADLQKNQLSGVAIQYLYLRSFFPSQKVSAGAVKAYNFYRQQAKQYWTSQSNYFRGMIALSLHRGGDPVTPKAILASLKENAILHEELGMYWKDNRRGYYWYEAPVETQSLLIEAFDEIGRDPQAVNEMQLWLLKQKQTRHWGNTKATAAACYALLLQGTGSLNNQPQVTIQLGNQSFASSDKNEAGTGYFKYHINGDAIQPQMGNIGVSIAPDPADNERNTVSWGAVYWQRFEDLDQITASSANPMPLHLKKQFYIVKNSDRGPVLEPVTAISRLKPGDKLQVRIELKADRDMEYVHMKDLRPSGTEPVNVISRYKWQDGLGYYESTKDAATNFFFDRLRKGTYVFEYPLYVSHSGNFSAGTATVQCMYAPEFTSHSEGVRITVE
ncbi:MAG: MG2 domain-containing protein [Chitinophagaceae bacterium]|nr:MG2 domain-containing protein [Chitinophagaceae bacterium]